MKKSSALSFASVALVALLAGCSSSGMSPAPASAPMRAITNPAQYAGLSDLYVADYETGRIVLLKNDGYTPDGSITTGINGPWDVTLDQAGNLYVANANGHNVTEYAPGASTPSFTYSFAMLSPRLLSVDRQGHLFEADFTGYDGPGRVNEYDQGSNELLNSCAVGGLWGVATDSSGDVFVDYNMPHGGGGRIAEFKGGLAGCSPTVLGVTLGDATGLVLDRRDDIIVGDFYANRIDVIPPPYSTIARRLATARRGPNFLSIDKANKRVFVSVNGFYHSYVLVMDYATGKLRQQLGYGRGGFDSPFGVADGPNAVP